MDRPFFGYLCVPVGNAPRAPDGVYYIIFMKVNGSSVAKIITDLLDRGNSILKIPLGVEFVNDHFDGACEYLLRYGAVAGLIFHRFTVSSVDGILCVEGIECLVFEHVVLIYAGWDVAI